MDKIEIVGIDTKSMIFDSFLRIDFRLISNIGTSIKVEIFDPFFNIKFIPGDHEMFVEPDIYYWVGFEVDKIANIEKPNLKFGFKIVITRTIDKEILYEGTLKNNYKSIEMRNISRSFPLDYKRIWIIGDSNVWSSFGGDNYQPIDISGYLPIRVGITSLSLNRFINGDYMSLMRSLPIYEGDLISFYLGEIDFRYTIHNVRGKGELSELVSGLLSSYLLTLKSIKSEFKNRIIVMSPNPPMCDNHLPKGSINTFLSGTESDRRLCWTSFDKFFKDTNIVEYLNWTKEYNIRGLIDPSKLFDGDHHIKEYSDCIKSLEKFIQDK